MVQVILALCILEHEVSYILNIMNLCFEQHTAGTQWTLSGTPMMTALLSRCLREKCALVVLISCSIRDVMSFHPGQRTAHYKVNTRICFTVYPHNKGKQTENVLKTALSRKIVV